MKITYPKRNATSCWYKNDINKYTEQKQVVIHKKRVQKEYRNHVIA